METVSLWSCLKGLLGELLLGTTHLSPSLQNCCVYVTEMSPYAAGESLIPFTHTLMGLLRGISMAQQHPAHQHSHLLPAPVFLGS